MAWAPNQDMEHPACCANAAGCRINAVQVDSLTHRIWLFTAANEYNAAAGYEDTYKWHHCEWE